MSTKVKDEQAGKSIFSGLLLTKMIHSFERRRRGGKRMGSRQHNERGMFHWHRRIIKEMKQNPMIQEKIALGHFDRYLEAQ